MPREPDPYGYEAQAFYNELAGAANAEEGPTQEEIVATIGDMEPGSTIAFPNGAVVSRGEDGEGWEVTVPPQEPDRPATPEEAFRNLLRGE